jgi:hypothetical protein
VATVQNIVAKGFQAKGTLDKSLRSALSAMNLPSTGDLELLKTKVEELEKLLTSVEAKLDALVEKGRPGPTV